jgi:twitching motility protein PilT
VDPTAPEPTLPAAYPAPVEAPVDLAPPAEAPVDLPPPSGYPAPPSPAPAGVFVPEAAPEPVATVPDPESDAPAGIPVAGASTMTRGTEQQVRAGDFSLVDALTIMLDRGASDLHLTSGAKPTIRVSGSLVPIDDMEVLTPPVLQRVLYSIITQAQRLKFEEDLELDFAYSLPGRARFRVNLYRQRDALGAAFRIIPFEIKSLESLGVPPSVANFAGLPRGFVLVTGPTGSGKSTTLAAMIDLANRTRHDHIMTVEDPIEFLHKHKSSLVNQREVGEDTWSFGNALKHVLRQDPDIILVGEMRDLETISVALTAAETGHLVFATLHTQDAAQTIDRVIDVFPPHQQQQVRQQLAMALQGVVCQTLCKTADGHGRVVATEVLVVTPAIRNLIREGKTHQIYSMMQSGAQYGMHTMDQHLAELVRTRRITYEMGAEKCHHIEDFNRLVGRA